MLGCAAATRAFEDGIMLKTLAAVATAALAGAIGTASASDMYSRPPSASFVDEPYAAYPLWTGYYYGANIGGAWGNAEVSDVNVAPLVRFHNKNAALLSGVQFGFNYQRGPLVIGPELDIGAIGFTHISRERGGIASTYMGSGFYGDIAGRLGYAFGGALVYVKGGYVHFDGDFAINDGVSRYVAHGFSGYTVGGGLEYKFSPSWSVKGEYQYLNLGSLSATLPDTNVYNLDLDAQTIKLGFNYHIGGGFGPLK
jgi:outer membrane immunogenic protein